MAFEPVTAALDLVRAVVTRIWPDKGAKERAEIELALTQVAAAHETALAQIALNTVEAGHRTLFVAGWRPSVGWVCSAGLAYAMLIQPALVAMGVDAPLSPMVEDQVPYLLGLLLGFGGLRTVEKWKGVTK